MLLNKKSIIFLVLLTSNLSITSLKLAGFCILKQQEWKGFYDNQHKYHFKCESIKFHGTFNNDCGFNICSRNKTIYNTFLYNDFYYFRILIFPYDISILGF